MLTFPLIRLFMCFSVLEVHNSELYRSAHVVIVADSEAAISISDGQGHNWSLIAMVTGENEKLVQGEVYQV